MLIQRNLNERILVDSDAEEELNQTEENRCDCQLSDMSRSAMLDTTDGQELTYDQRAPLDKLELAPAPARTGQVEHIWEAVRPHFVENVEEEAARKGVGHLVGRRPRRVVSPKTRFMLR